MKLEIEITEDEIRSAIERKIRVAIADRSKEWDTQDKITSLVKQAWTATATRMVEDMVGDSAALRRMVDAEVEKRIRSKVTAAFKAMG